MKYLSFFMIFILFSACSTHQDIKYKSDTKVEDGFPMHGNFCGKNIPTIYTQNLHERIRILNKIKPLDDIDYACKEHDLCYAKNGYYNPQCDRQLVDTIYRLDKIPIDSCNSLRGLIVGYFNLVTPSTSRNIPEYVGNTIGGVKHATNSIIKSASSKVAKVVYGAAELTATAITAPLIITSNAILGNDLTKNLELKGTKYIINNDSHDLMPDRYTRCFQQR